MLASKLQSVIVVCHPPVVTTAPNCLLTLESRTFSPYRITGVENLVSANWLSGIGVLPKPCFLGRVKGHIPGVNFTRCHGRNTISKLTDNI